MAPDEQATPPLADRPSPFYPRLERVVSGPGTLFAEVAASDAYDYGDPVFWRWVEGLARAARSCDAGGG